MMKAILEKSKLPKMIVANEVAQNKQWNKYLLKPWKAGEIVKVHPDQTPSLITTKNFNRNFVRVIRKDEDGFWSLVYVENWENFNLLRKND